MSAELIDRMEIRADGVYLSSHLSENANTARTWYCEKLSEAYKNEGQKGLDREMFTILFEYARLGAYYKSTARYHNALKLPEVLEIKKRYFNLIDSYYESSNKPSMARQYEREMRDRMYAEIASKCERYDKKQKNQDLER